MNPELPAEAGKLLRKRGKSLSVAESCTGGLLGGLITAVPGSSEYFLGGVICYADRVKRDLLGVPPDVLEKRGAVSRQTASLMAEGVCRLFKTDCGIAVTGIAGPGGGTAEKPVGLVYTGICRDGRVEVIKNMFSGGRERIRTQTCVKALEMLIDMLK